ncbi:helix-turn-helix domain-containing protein [Fructobacillus tropaeoli]|uniref:helix-turn-helix domain-containing protein n=1 Tax=Fructobacillus tropaeoli TaxID=709323 RepID=UPI001456060C|nr:helix-turn-helix domain-containing protein [Fructobacillus tropaeoli]
MNKNRLKEMRKSRGLTLAEIPNATGISRSTYSNYENSTTEPKLETWEKMAKFYGVTPAYLVGWED